MKKLLFIIALLIPVIGVSQDHGFIGQTQMAIESKFSGCEIEKNSDTAITVWCESMNARFYLNKDKICWFSTFHFNEEETTLLHEKLISEGYTRGQSIAGDDGYGYTKESGNAILYVDISESEEYYFCMFSEVDLK